MAPIQSCPRRRFARRLSDILVAQNLNADSAAIALLWDFWDVPPTAPTTDCNVVGTNKDNVDDEGVGDILVGVNNMHGPPWTRIKDAMNRKQQMLKGGTAFSKVPVQ